MRQTVPEPGKETRLLRRLRKRVNTNERFRALVASIRQTAVDSLVSPRWLTEAVKLVVADETRRLYAITQSTPTRGPGPKPQRKDDSECGGSSVE